MEKFVIIKDSSKVIRRFGLQGRTLEFKIAPIPKGAEPVSWVRDAITQIVLMGTNGLTPADYVGFTFCSNEFSRGQGWMRLRPASEITTDEIFDKISSIYQSNSTGLNTETFCLGVTSVKMPTGKGRNRTYNTFDEECAKRKGIIVINNRDNLCLARALVVAKAYADKDSEIAKIRYDTGKLQRTRAHELMEAAGVSISAGGCGIPELQLFQCHLQQYKIMVYAYGSKGRDVIFKGNGHGPSLNLLFHKGHYNVIISLTAAFCCSYFCSECSVPYDNKKNHHCGKTCPACRQSPSCSNELSLKCESCKRTFRGQVCFEQHLQHGICAQMRRCEECFKIIEVNRSHTCGEIFCKICNEHQPSGHLCFIQPDSRKPPSENYLYIFYDLETMQEKVRPDGSLLHEPNLCVFRQCCDICISSDSQICKKCGLRLQILKCNDPISPFVHHVLTLRKKFKKVVVIAHNGGGFDHQFVLSYILTKTDLKPELIMRGTKLISMSVGNVQFLDSLNYFPMALSGLPKSFGISELEKGHFPHLFNRLENQSYVGSMPPIEYYCPSNYKSDKELTAFSEWYNARLAENYVFDFQKEIIAYCISDVDILAQACLRFRRMMLEETNVCPFMEASTIASTCNKVFRRNFLKPNTIGIIPKNGYRWRDIQSKIAIQWLVWEEKERGILIHHAAKGPEASVGTIKVDGLCRETNQIFEFQGCYFHGCKCLISQRDQPLKDNPSETLNYRYEATQAKLERLKSLGFEVIEMRECEFRKQLSTNIELKNYTELHVLLAQLPLEPRDAFYGGRTGNVVGYYKAKEGEIIKYTDICSLYPWVCKYGKFPVGHPKVLVGSECSSVDLSSITGVIKCKVLPPSSLFHPVLPQKINNKLMFVLCRICGETFNTGNCHHSDDERALTGTWVAEELIKAVNVGYDILEIFEIWSYESIQFDKEHSGLFTAMMNKFLKIKQEASDWPSHCRTQEKKEQYIEEFLQREDIQLEFSKICSNPGLRSLAKLMLNSFWGKFGQRENQSKTSIINQSGELFAMLSDPSIFVNTILPVNEETLIVNWEYKDECYAPLPTVNVVLASYVTALARLKLYSYLEKLNDRVLYYDTDSVVFISKPEEYDIPTGEFIGDMTDELGSGSYITEFVSGGPKNYAYKFWHENDQNEKVVCKVKGISLTLQALETINFEKIKEMVLYPSEPISILTQQIRRTQDHDVITKNMSKMYKPNSTKRKFLPNHSSVPFGFKKSKPTL